MESSSPADEFVVPTITVSDTEEPGFTCIIFCDPTGLLGVIENDSTLTMDATKAQSEDGNQNTASSPSLTDEKLGDGSLAKEALNPDLESEKQSETVVVVVAEVVEANEPKPEPKVEGQETDKENDEFEEDPTEDAIHYRINFRCRNRVLSDTLYVDQTTPAQELSRDSILLLETNENGQTVARTFQFCHTIKESTYKNKYLIQIDEHKLKFSEREDSTLISRGGDTTVLMGTSSKLFRNRNMAMEELRNILNLNLRVSKALFCSTNSDQMGQIDLVDYTNTVTTPSLTVLMDSYPDVVQFIKVCKAPIFSLTVMCQDEYENVTDLEQVRTATNLKMTGRSNVTDKGLMSLEANSFEFNSDKVTSKGLNAFVKAKLASGIADDFLAVVECNRGEWEPKEVLKGVEYVEYPDKATFTDKNGPLPFNIYRGTLACIETKTGDKIVVIISRYCFQLFKEELKPRMLVRDREFNDCEY